MALGAFAMAFACGAGAFDGKPDCRLTVAVAAVLAAGSVTDAVEPLLIGMRFIVVVVVVDNAAELEMTEGAGAGTTDPPPGVDTVPPPQATSVPAISASAATPRCGFTKILR